MTAQTSTAPDRPEDRILEPMDWARLAIPGTIWGSSFYLIAEGLDAFSPYVVTWLRLGFGVAVIAALPAVRRPVPAGTWPRVLLLSVVWMAVPLTLFAFAEQRVSSSVTGMLNGANPIFTATVAVVMLGVAPPRRQTAGLAIGLVGIVLIALPTWNDGSSSAGGVVMILAALLCYGVALNVAGPLQRRVGSLAVIGRALPVAFVLTAPFGLSGVASSTFAWRSALAVSLLGVLGTGLAFVVMASNAGRYGSTRAASTTYLIPAVSIVLGVTLRGEDVRPIALVGCAIALVGAYVVNTAVRDRGRVRVTVAT